jgi:hypothetical protein
MKATLLAIVALAFSVTQASAVSLAVKLACKEDYFAHCSMHAVGSPGVRKCMRAVGPRLSQGCISALRDAGMIKSSKVAAKNKTYTKKYAATKHASKKYASYKAASKKYASTNKYGSKTYASKKQASKKSYANKNYSKKRYVRKPSRKEYARREVARG